MVVDPLGPRQGEYGGTGLGAWADDQRGSGTADVVFAIDLAARRATGTLSDIIERLEPG